MLLYATTTSERASKGQGGNEYLDIEVFVGNKSNSYNLATLKVRHKENIVETMGTGQSLDGYVIEHDGEVIAYILDDSEKLKGKKQKGKTIPYCNICGETRHIQNEECLKCKSTDVGYMEL